MNDNTALPSLYRPCRCLLYFQVAEDDQHKGVFADDQDGIVVMNGKYRGKYIYASNPRGCHT